MSILLEAGDFMDYMTVKEASERWGVSERAITYHLTAGRIGGAEKKGNLWLISITVPKPEDRRSRENNNQPGKEDA